MAEDDTFAELHTGPQPSPDAVANLEWHALPEQAVLAMGFKLWMPELLREVIDSMRQMADVLEARWFPPEGRATDD